MQKNSERIFIEQVNIIYHTEISQKLLLNYIDFIEEIRNPGKLEVSLTIDKIDNLDHFVLFSDKLNSFYDVVNINIKNINNLDLRMIEYITHIFKEITIDYHEPEELDRLLLISSKNKNTTTIYKIDENTIDKFAETFDFFNKMRLKFNYIVDVLGNKINPKKFVEDLLLIFGKIVLEYKSSSILAPFVSKIKLVNFDKNIIIDNNDVIVNNNYIKNTINIAEITQDKIKLKENNIKEVINIRSSLMRGKTCEACHSLFFCKGGTFGITEEQKNIFCAINQGIAQIGNEFSQYMETNK